MNKLLLSGLLVASLTAVVQAQITTYRYIGTVTSVGANLGTAVQIGQAYEADFTFDESVALHNNLGGFALYKSMHHEIRISTGSGTLTWSASTPLSNNFNNGFAVHNNNGGRDAFIVDAAPGLLVGPSLNGNAISSLSFTLQDSTQVAFSSTAIPTFLTPGAFPTKVLNLLFANQFPAEIIRFDLTSIVKNPAPIPEPSTYALVLGLAALVGLRLRRRAS